MASAAARQKRARERKRAGQIIVSVAIDDVDIPEALIALGLLARADEADRNKIGYAIGQFLALSRVTPSPDGNGYRVSLEIGEDFSNASGDPPPWP